MKKGDRIQCVNNTTTVNFMERWLNDNPITKGKIYKCIKAQKSDGAIYVINDNGDKQGYNSSRFKLFVALNTNIRVI